MTPRIQSIVQNFITELQAALAEEGSDAIRAALTGQTAQATPVRRAKARAQASVPRAEKRAKGAKRTPEEIETQTKALLAAIKKNPGSNIETLGQVAGISTKEAAIPIANLLAEKAIKKTGTRRGTRYTAR